MAEPHDIDGILIAWGDRGGLGLVGIRERASALHGTFEIESALGKGTRLTITLPVSTP